VDFKIQQKMNYWPHFFVTLLSKKDNQITLINLIVVPYLHHCILLAIVQQHLLLYLYSTTIVTKTNATIRRRRAAIPIVISFHLQDKN